MVLNKPQLKAILILLAKTYAIIEVYLKLKKGSRLIKINYYYQKELIEVSLHLQYLYYCKEEALIMINKLINFH